MSINKKKFLKNLKRVLVFLLLFIFVGLGIIYYVVASNHSQIANNISHYANEQLGVELGFSDYHISRTKHFPFVFFEMNNIYIKGVHYESYDKQLLKVGKVSFKIHPWDLFRGKYNFQELQLKDADIRIYKDSLGIANTQLFPNREKHLDSMTSTPVTAEEQPRHLRNVLDLDKVTFENVALDFTDDYSHKAYRVKFNKAVMTATESSDRVMIHLDATCDFGGLFFNMEKGGYLENKKARLVLNMVEANDSIFLDNSQLHVQNEILQLSGKFSKDKPNYLQLNIDSDAILLENAKTLLDKKLEHTLSMFSIKEPVEAHFELEGVLSPGNPQRMHVYFEAVDTDIDFKNVIQISNTNIKGSYQNDYKTHVDSVIQLQDASLILAYVNGDIFGKHKAQIKGILHDIKNLSDVEVHAKIDADLVALNSLLPNKNIELKKGKAQLDINYRGNVTTITKSETWSDQQVNVNTTLQNIDLQFNDVEIKDLKGELSADKKEVRFNDLQVRLSGIPIRINGIVQNIVPFALAQEGLIYSDLTIEIDNLNLDNLFAQKNKNNNSQKTNQPLGNQLAEIIQPIAKILDANLKVKINNLSYQNQFFRNTSFHAKFSEDELANDSILVISDLKSDLLDAAILEGNLTLKNKNNPSISANLQISGDAARLAKCFPNKTIQVKNGSFSLITHSSFVLNDLSDTNALLQHAKYNGTLSLENINAQLLKDDLPIQNFSGNIFFTPDSIFLKNTNLETMGMTANIEGHLDNYLSLILGKGPIAHVDFKIRIPEIDYEKIKLSVSNQNNQQTFNPKLFLKNLHPFLDKIDGKVELDIAKVSLPKYPMEEISLTVSTNHDCLEDNSKACLNLEKLHAKMFGDTPIDIAMQFYDITQTPHVNFELKTDMPIEELSRLIYNDDFLPKSGHIQLSLDYRNEIKDEINVQNFLLDADFKGQLKLEDVSLYYGNQGYTFNDLNGGLDFNNKHLKFDFPNMKVNENEVTINGTIDDYIPFFFQTKSNFNIAANLSSPHLEFENFQTPRAIKEENIQPVALPDSSRQNRNLIDRLLNEATLRTSLNVDTVSYRNFEAYDVIGQAHLEANELKLDSLSMNTAGGELKVNGEVTNLAIHQPKLNVDLHLANINATEVFNSFDNFGQDVLTHENLKGTLYSDISFSASTDDDYKIIPESMKGELQLKMENGEFIDFVGFKNLTGFLFKRRHMDDIYFDKLEATLLLDSLDIIFNHFNLNSTAVTLGVSGIYTFSDENRTNLLLEVPIGNLFRPYIDKEVISEHLKTRKGKPIFVEVIEVDKKMKFKIKLFNNRNVH